MKTISHPMRTTALLLAVTLHVANVAAQDAAPPSAKELAARLHAGVTDGSSLVRLRMEFRQTAGAEKTVFQLQAKARRTASATEVIYQVLWPKDRKGEAFLVRKSARQAASGAVFVLPDSLTTLPSSRMQDGIFGSDLAYEDLVDSFFAWENQAIVGTEVVDRIPCQILESKPGRGDRTSYSRVRSWIDVKRLVPMRVEKYLASGQLARRIDTTRVAKDDTDRLVPAGFVVRRAGHESVTELDGSNSRHDVTYQDADFTPEALRSLATSGSRSR